MCHICISISQRNCFLTHFPFPSTYNMLLPSPAYQREYDENEADPYHGKQEKQLEAEALDLPDDLNLENEERSDEDKEGEGTN